jgi:hypothetical protein
MRWRVLIRSPPGSRACSITKQAQPRSRTLGGIIGATVVAAPARRYTSTMGNLDDVARFAPNDSGELCEAAFACPLCLHRPSMALLVESDAGGAARCLCASCDVTWSVLMTAEQLLRIALAPSHAIQIQVASAWTGRRGAQPPRD